MQSPAPSADVCTPKRPRRTQQPKLPYPAALPASAPHAEFWTVRVARREAELAAFMTFAIKARKNKDLEWHNAPLSTALACAEISLVEKLQSAKDQLASALERAEKVPA